MLPFFENCTVLVREHFPLLCKGMGVTLRMALLGTAGGTLLAALIGIPLGLPDSKSPACRILQRILRGILDVYVAFFKWTPLIVQAMVLHWGIAAANGGTPLRAFTSGVLALTLHSSAYIADILREKLALSMQPPHEDEKAVRALPHAIGSALLQSLLPIGYRFAENIGNTAVFTVIGATELYFYAGVIRLQGQPLVESYFVICILYFLMVFALRGCLMLICRLFEKRRKRKNEASDVHAAVAAAAAAAADDAANADTVFTVGENETPE